MYTLGNTDSPRAAVQHVAATVRQQIDDFRPHVPLIQSLRNPGMRARHWESLNEQTGVHVVWSVALTYSRCRELGIEREIDALAAISESAAKEYAIEQTLDKMAREWDLVELEVTPYKNSGRTATPVHALHLLVYALPLAPFWGWGNEFKKSRAKWLGTG